MNVSKDLKTFDREEVLKASIDYFKGDTLAADVWINKYCLKDSNGNLYERTPDDMHHRLAREFARTESKYPNPLSEKEIYDLLKDFKYIIPQGSPMAGIGNNFQYVSLSNCFVIGNDVDSDSYGGIMKIDQELVQLMKRRAGVGIDISFIRPSKSPVQNSALTSTGVVPFMERYSNSTREVAQDGRRGALMLSISISNPEAESFIDAKTVKGKVTGANVSVRVNDKFMNCVMNNEKYIQTFPCDSDKPLISKEVDARKLWEKIISNAWSSAEPGVLFWDKIISESLPDCYSDLGFKTISTNPCGEIPLCAGDSCRLLAVNLFSYVNNPFSDNPSFDFDLFVKHTKIAQRLMDDIVDLEIEKIDSILKKIDSDPEPYEIKRTEINLWKNIKNKCLAGRRTGLGITAEGDMLAAMNITYGTDEAINFSEKVHMMMKHAAYSSSNEMAQERGFFPIWDKKREANNPYLLRIKSENEQLYNSLMRHGRRNIALQTLAPVGSLSILTQTTSGIEPAYLIHYTRRKKINPNDKNSRVDFVDEVGDSWQEYKVFHHNFETYLKVKGYNIDEVKNMTNEEINEIIKKSPYYKATSNDVDWVKKIEMQGRIQKHIDHSISCTTNLPNDVTKEVVSKVYETGWKSGCKGLTVYRDGSRSGVLVTKKEKDKEKLFKESNAPVRPKSLDCSITKFINNGEKWIGFIGLFEGRPYELFTGKLENFPIPNYVESGSIVKTKSRETNVSSYDFIYQDKLGNEIKIPSLNHAFDKEYYDLAKTFSAILRHGMPLPYVISLIDSLNLDGDLINTWKSGVKRMIKRFIADGTKISNKKCPECGSESLQFIEGCLTCSNCGNSKCG